ncbi:hypothetical protein BESB_027670 [Besnoitia besnoiti]|uniref:Uncharacterized protein n=1 Tax=Besnoitia besnoiti TaxID=94643 RepID=A0A2A9M7J6_BESBE|nr:uncharacterized protein BESB_027670 [Besnoitia besnoiti]PFH31332.1 hypothetical protein BESB_027670 [Besnoitia besnoiti]
MAIHPESISSSADEDRPADIPSEEVPEEGPNEVAPGDKAQSSASEGLDGEDTPERESPDVSENAPPPRPQEAQPNPDDETPPFAAEGAPPSPDEEAPPAPPELVPGAPRAPDEEIPTEQQRSEAPEVSPRSSAVTAELTPEEKVCLLSSPEPKTKRISSSTQEALKEKAQAGERFQRDPW